MTALHVTAMLPPLRLRAREALAPLHSAGLHDAPPHVRAASSLVVWRSEEWMVQDDVALLVVRHPDGRLDARPLPPGPDGQRIHDDARGTKHLKRDLEALFVYDDALWALGSGSAAPREVLVRYDEFTAEVRSLPAFFTMLRAHKAFSGSELNLEGAVVHAGELWLLQRGNGATIDGTTPVSALASWPVAALRATWASPTTSALPLSRVLPLDLGEIGGVRLTPTDLALAPDQSLLILAAAEACPDAVRDGPVTGCALFRLADGVLTGQELLTPDGHALTEKAEGLTVHDDGTLVLVTDVDDGGVPAGRWVGDWR